MHESYEREEEVSGSTNRGFGLVFAAFFAILTAIKIYAEAYEWAIGWACASAVMLVLALFAAHLLAPFNKLWTKFGLLLHKIVNPLVMGAMFFFVLTPVGIMMRLFGWDALNRKLDANCESYWIEREPPGPEPDTMKRQF